MDKQTLWLELYKGYQIIQGSFEEHFKPNGTDGSEWIEYIKNSEGIPLFELHVRLIGDFVEEVSAFKADVSDSPRLYINEKGLTSTEKKLAKEIFDKCFCYPRENEFLNVLSCAVSSCVEYKEFHLLGQTEDSITYLSPDGKKKKLKKEYIRYAIHYSHEHLEILRDEPFIQEFCSCIGVKIWEPIFMILKSIDTATYPNIEKLEAQYRYQKLKSALEDQNFLSCQKYMDVLKSKEVDISKLFFGPIHSQNREICIWLLENSQNNPCNLVPALEQAIRYYPSFADELLEAGRCKPMDIYRWPLISPIDLAAAEKKYSLVKKMVINGFPLNAQNGNAFYSSLNLDEIKELIHYSVELTEKVLERIWQAQRFDILDIIEEEKDRWIPSSVLMALYIRHDSHDRFLLGLKKGYSCDADTFALCYEHNPVWADELIQYGFDINTGNGMPLFKACDRLDVEMFQFLIDHGANAFAKPENYMSLYSSALFACRDKNSLKLAHCQNICYRLLELGLDPITESVGSPSIICQMMDFPHPFKTYLVDWLAERNELNMPDRKVLSPSDHAHVPLYYLRKWDEPIDIELAHYMIQKGAIANADDISGDKLFYWACDSGNLEYIKLLAEAGANINETLPTGYNGLCISALKGNYSVCEYLIKQGMNVNFLVDFTDCRTNYPHKKVYKSVLDIALEHNQTKCVELLRKAGAKTASEI